MADDDAPAPAIRLDRVRKLEAENAALKRRIQKLRDYLESWREEYSDLKQMADEYFEVLGEDDE